MSSTKLKLSRRFGLVAILAAVVGLIMVGCNVVGPANAAPTTPMTTATSPLTAVNTAVSTAAEQAAEVISLKVGDRAVNRPTIEPTSCGDHACVNGRMFLVKTSQPVDVYVDGIPIHKKAFKTDFTGGTIFVPSTKTSVGVCIYLSADDSFGDCAAGKVRLWMPFASLERRTAKKWALSANTFYQNTVQRLVYIYRKAGARSVVRVDIPPNDEYVREGRGGCFEEAYLRGPQRDLKVDISARQCD